MIYSLRYAYEDSISIQMYLVDNLFAYILISSICLSQRCATTYNYRVTSLYITAT